MLSDMVLEDEIRYLGKRRIEIVPVEHKPRTKPRTEKEQFRDYLSSGLIHKTFKEWFNDHKKDYGSKHFKMLGQSRHLIKTFEGNFSDRFLYFFRLWKDKKYSELDNLFIVFKEALEIKIRSVKKYKRKYITAEFNLLVLDKRLKNRY